MDAGLDHSAIVFHSRSAASRMAGALRSNDFGDDLIAEIKHLRAFAICLSGSISAADELVEATLLRAWSKFEQFRSGTTRELVFLTILRTIFYSSFRKRAPDAQDDDGVYGGLSSVYQEGHPDQQSFRRALAQLPNLQREVLILVDAGGYTYEESAAICQVEIGTVRRRVNRARLNLVKLLSL